MNYYHGENKQSSFFEGWYFKQQTEKQTIAIISSVHYTKHGNQYAMIQVITNTHSYQIRYDYSEFEAMKNKLHIRIGGNLFCQSGVLLKIKTTQLELHGKVYFDDFTPPKYDIMGPFAHVPFLECHHGIISMQHRLTGKLYLNGEEISFANGTGYIETDWGRSFPKGYTWTQCNRFETDCSVMAAIANIPMFGTSFQGCIANVVYQGKEYRFATYLGVKVLKVTENNLILQQGNYQLVITVLQKASHPLLAPQYGHMERTIHESASCIARYELYESRHQIFSLNSNQASYEYVAP
ncbi:tocopherol cyclase family protein [Paludicola sp. MB14-C6]|uniref:tocopherol cyclase family protein n=1 Tax=Paludihabitans sp. MB14-C6 TaxID=3070656 RepID=UPI0027DC6470|nr:tocopherol cyclase family protein [Paludicola sp. MB14-C6]WMJ24207.1 tocopherol cyclase family protein [Paludicola sp. MB14-C6]